ncbi:hypothetical protein ACPC0Q_10015 [Bacillus bombysepticus]
MNHTKLYLRFGISSGALQNLAEELLKKERDWVNYNHIGNVEGADQTRSGQPDLLAYQKNGKKVHIQITKDSRNGKMLKDLEESLKVLEISSSTIGAICVAFTSYDPKPEEITECKALCSENACSFILYKNNEIADLLDKKYTELRAKYLSIPDNTKPIIMLDLEREEGYAKIENGFFTHVRIANIGTSPAVNIKVTAIRKKSDGSEVPAVPCFIGLIMAQEVRAKQFISGIVSDNRVLTSVKDETNEYVIFKFEYEDNNFKQYSTMQVFTISTEFYGGGQSKETYGKLELVR